MNLQTVLWGVSALFFVSGYYFYWREDIFDHRTIISSIVLTATFMALGALYAELGSNLISASCLLISLGAFATAVAGILVLAIDCQSAYRVNDVLKKQLEDRDEADSKTQEESAN